MFTVNMYLNKEFEGGATRFYFEEEGKEGERETRMDVEALRAATGSACVFDHSTKSYLHDGEEVTKGVKYLLRTDGMYRKTAIDGGQD